MDLSASPLLWLAEGCSNLHGGCTSRNSKHGPDAEVSSLEATGMAGTTVFHLAHYWFVSRSETYEPPAVALSYPA